MDSDNKKVYMHSFDLARENGEVDLCRDSWRRNKACSEEIKEAIYASNFEESRYDLTSALNNVISEYGAERVNMVLANTVQYKDYDGRFSQVNRAWAESVPLPDLSSDYRSSSVCETHPAILDGFINGARREQEKQRKPSIMKKLNDTVPQASPRPENQASQKRDAGKEL